ncbi:MAG TPA: FxSxx-COOH system tetratricopeptide repeat protein [Actinocrinis sp.]|nr:FxSxx-COOH system tetratricopeptide repeat protein [Actinocrinis sp.]
MRESVRSEPAGGQALCLDWIDVADALWLAAVADLDGALDGAPGYGTDDTAAPGRRAGPNPESGQGGADSVSIPKDVPVPISGPYGGSAPTVLIPAVRAAQQSRGRGALPATREIGRSLQPFKRRVLSQVELEPDEEATAERAADDGLWLPQMRPAPARWLALALVVDASPSMAVWRPTVSAFLRLLRQHGAFSRCREYLLKSVAPEQQPVIFTGSGFGVRHPAELIDPSGRQAVLVVSDGRSPAWRGKPIADLMRLWGRYGPLAVVNPYPQRYWHRGELIPQRFQVRAPRPVSPNAQLAVREPLEWRDPFADEPDGGFPVPVLELSARWIGWWAQLVTRPTGDWVDASLFLAGGSAPRTAPPPVRGGSSRDRVLRFRAGSTPLAFALATHMAAAPLDLALIRRIQDAMLPQSLPHHLAEVVASELVEETADRGGPATLDFAIGVRDVLLSCSTRDTSARVLRMVADHYGESYPGAQTLIRTIEAPELVPDFPLSGEALPLARIELAVLRALSGPYTARADRLAKSIEMVLGDGAATRPPPPQDDFAAPAGSAHDMIGESADMPGPLDDNDFDALLWPISRPVAPTDPYPLPGRGVRADEEDSDLSVDSLFSGQEQDIGPAVWGNVPPRNPVFTGREELLTQLEQRLRTESLTAVLPQALHGMGGVGKSQIAIEYTYRSRSKYELVWWIPSEQPGQILASLAELGEHLGLEPSLEASAAVVRVQTALQTGVPYARWLLIFDNAETLDAVRPYFPESGTGKVLVTSRNPEWSQVAQTLEVDVFTREESIGLLKRRNPRASDEDADRLALTLGDLPLAVEHASAWCATRGISVPDYLVLLEEKLGELVSLVPEPGYELPVAAAWSVALDRLQEENLPALRLLQVCSFFAPEPISRELFTSPRMYPTVPELDEALQNPSRLSRIFRDIQRYGLARIDHRSNTIQLHRLVKSVLISGMEEPRRGAIEHGAHVLLAGGNPGAPDKRAQWPRFQELAPHVAVSRMITCEDSWARELVLHVIEFYFHRGDFASSRDLAEQAVNEWRTSLGRDHLQTLRAGKWLGFVQRSLGAFAAAREINQDCLDQYQSTLGADDEGTIDAMSVVAADLRMAGEFNQARELDFDAFRRARRALGEDEPTTLKAAHSLGVSLRLTGDFRTARQLDGDTYRRRVATLGEEHPETLLTLNGLTLDHRECGAYLKAHEWQESLYERYQTLFGPSHPTTISAGRNLAVARRRSGDHENARKLAEEILRRYRQRFGPDNPETIAAALIYAVDLRESGALEQAQELGEQTVEQYRTVLGDEHPYTLYARTNLAIVLRLRGLADESHGHNSAVLAQLGRQLGATHILTLTCSVNLASDLSVLGEHQSAYDLDRTTVEHSREVLGRDHPSTLAASLNLSFDLRALNRREESTRIFEETLGTYRMVLGADHPAIAAAVDSARANCDVDPMPL